MLNKRIKFWCDTTHKFWVGTVYKENLFNLFVKCGKRKFCVPIRSKWCEI